MATKKAVTEKSDVKKSVTKNAEPAKAEPVVADKTIEKKVPAKKAAAKKAAEVIIQSELGGEITPADILAKVGNVEKVYIRVDQNKAYWVRGEETGSVDLW